MKGDFSRNTFRPAKHYSGVRMQQGRVQLDADWNEQIDIQNHLDVTTRRDVIGFSGTPQEPGVPADQTGFALFLTGGLPTIRKGRYYVDGVLCENDKDQPVASQEDLPGVALPTTNGRYLAYLDVWQRHVTAKEDTELREVALGGPDTATRTRTVWQVKLFRLTSPHDAGPVEAVPCDTFGTPAWTPDSLKPSGTLAARAEPEQDSDNPCIVAAGAGFRRLENQLYRVEIHRGNLSGGTATFKWSRDNGILFTDVKSVDAADRLIVVDEEGKDGYRRFQPNQWIEITNEGRVLRGEPGELVRIAGVTGNRLTIDAATWPANLPEEPRTVRAWDMVGTSGAMDVTAGPNWVTLESGVQVRFTGTTYRSGDYWLIPARTVTGDILWPKDGANPRNDAPHGIRHHYCALGILERTGAGTGTWTVHDCRKLFAPLTEHKTLVYAGGDGQEVMPTKPPAAPARLARPLRAGVFNGRIPVPGARVRFSVVTAEGNGTLADVSNAANTGQTITVYTGSNGIAEVYWTPEITNWQTVGNPRHSQVVEARLLDHGNQEVHAPLRYFASLSVASKVAYDPDDAQEILNDTHTVQEALDTLSRQLVLTYEGGDGQEVMPGEILPHYLRVGVARHQRRAANQTVRFRVLGESGGEYTGIRIAGSGNPWASTITATTDDRGIAEVEWLPNSGDATQQVEARLLVNGTEVHLPLVFTARLSLADRVAYQAGGCQTLNNSSTVQEALDTLCRQRTFLYLGGDGQEGVAGQELGAPLSVAVMTGENPVVNAIVSFQIIQAVQGAQLRSLTGQAQTGTSLLVRTDSNGIASVAWRLSTQEQQRVTATLVERADVPTRLPPINFAARLAASGRDEPGVRVRRVCLVANPELIIENNATLPHEWVPLLRQGLRIICSEELAPYRNPQGQDLALPRPVVTLSVDLAYPLTTQDTEFWRSQFGRYPGQLGFESFPLRGEARISGPNIHWVPSEDTQTWLEMVRYYGWYEFLTQLTLRIRGSFIHSADGNRVLDGEVVSRSLQERFAIGLPNAGDGRRGGDFEQWFWMQNIIIGLVPVLSSTGAVVEMPRTTAPGLAPPGGEERKPRTLTSGLERPWGLARDMKRKELLVADTGTSSVQLFSLEDTGSTRPMGQLSEGVTQPTSLVMDAARDELYVANGGDDTVAVFTRDSKGAFKQARVIGGKKTGLAGPLGLALDPDRKALFVAGAGRTQVTQGLTVGSRTSRTTFLAVFDAAAQGDVAPKVRWTGDQLGLNRAAGLAVDAQRKELYVADYGADTIAVYSLEALLTSAESVAPVRTLVGKATGLSQPTSVALDATGGELWVANAKSGTVTVYARDAKGDTAPLRTQQVPAAQREGLRTVLP